MTATNKKTKTRIQRLERLVFDAEEIMESLLLRNGEDAKIPEDRHNDMEAWLDRLNARRPSAPPDEEDTD